MSFKTLNNEFQHSVELLKILHPMKAKSMTRNNMPPKILLHVCFCCVLLRMPNTIRHLRSVIWITIKEIHSFNACKLEVDKRNSKCSRLDFPELGRAHASKLPSNFASTFVVWHQFYGIQIHSFSQPLLDLPRLYLKVKLSMMLHT